MTPLPRQTSDVVPFVPLKNKLALVRCPACGSEWEDMDAATHQDGYSEVGCPKRCGRLTDPVYVLSMDGPRERWVRA